MSSVLPSAELNYHPYQLAFDKVAPSLQDVVAIENQFFILKRRYLGLPLYKVRQIGWQYDWAQPLTENVINRLTQLNSKWSCYRSVCYDSSLQKMQPVLKSAELKAYYREFQPESLIDLSAGWEAYWQGRSHNHKRDMQRHLNKLKKQGYELQDLRSTALLDETLPLFFEWHGQYWEAKGVASIFNQEAERQLLQHLLTLALEEGQLWGWAIRIDGQWAAISLGLTSQDNVFSLLSIYNSDFHKFSPGSTLLMLELQQAVAEKKTCFRLGPGASFQKNRWQTHTQQTHTLLIPNPRSIRGRLLAAYYQHRKGFKPVPLA